MPIAAPGQTCRNPALEEAYRRIETMLTLVLPPNINAFFAPTSKPPYSVPNGFGGKKEITPDPEPYTAILIQNDAYEAEPCGGAAAAEMIGGHYDESTGLVTPTRHFRGTKQDTILRMAETYLRKHTRVDLGVDEQAITEAFKNVRDILRAERQPESHSRAG